MCIYMCVCVCEREEGKETQRERARLIELYISLLGSISDVPLHSCRWQPTSDPRRIADSAKQAQP